MPKLDKLRMPKLSADDTVVIVMGVSGSGKSNFIAKACGGNYNQVNDKQLAQQPNIQTVTAKHPDNNYRVTFVDTPGLDNPHMSDDDILGQTTDWLNSRDVTPAAIIYLHRITDNRMSHSSWGTLKLVASLCGQAAMRNVVLITSMWDTVGRDVGKRREEELKTTFWKEMLDAGCRTARFENTRESAWDAIGDVKGSRTAVKSQGGVVPPSQYSSELPEQTPSFFIVMGPTGVGKSTFIKYATGGAPEIGKSLKSCTGEITEFKVRGPDGRDVVFVDTPGFDDTHKSDVEILAQVAEWLLQAHRGKFSIKAILYLQRISDNRMAGSPLKNLQLFASLCGTVAMPKVIFVTTMWSHVPKEVGEIRESELKESFWNDMMSKGCEVVRFEDTRESAWGILDHAKPQVRDKHPAQVLISEQMLDKRKSLKATAAGITLNTYLQKLQKHQKEADRKLRELTAKQTDIGATRQLREQKVLLEAKISQVNEQLQTLKRGWFQELLDPGQADVPHVPTE